jgi:hypothetical protein
MSQQYDPEDPAEMDKWIRSYYNIKDESTDAFLVRNGISADTPQGLVKRMRMALAWLQPQLTDRTRTMYDEIKTIIDDLDRKTSPIRPYEPGKPLDLAQEPNEADKAACEKAMFLFEQAKSLHRVESTLAAQEAFRRAQSARASKPRKLDDGMHERIAKAYWALLENGRAVRGGVKALAGRYDLSTEMVRKIAKKYPPN